MTHVPGHRGPARYDMDAGLPYPEQPDAWTEGPGPLTLPEDIPPPLPPAAVVPPVPPPVMAPPPVNLQTDHHRVIQLERELAAARRRLEVASAGREAGGLRWARSGRGLEQHTRRDSLLREVAARQAEVNALRQRGNAAAQARHAEAAAPSAPKPVPEPPSPPATRGRGGRPPAARGRLTGDSLVRSLMRRGAGGTPMAEPALQEGDPSLDELMSTASSQESSVRQEIKREEEKEAALAANIEATGLGASDPRAAPPAIAADYAPEPWEFDGTVAEPEEAAASKPTGPPRLTQEEAIRAMLGRGGNNDLHQRARLSRTINTGLTGVARLAGALGARAAGAGAPNLRGLGAGGSAYADSLEREAQLQQRNRAMQVSALLAQRRLSEQARLADRRLQGLEGYREATTARLGESARTQSAIRSLAARREDDLSRVDSEASARARANFGSLLSTIEDTPTHPLARSTQAWRRRLASGDMTAEEIDEIMGSFDQDSTLSVRHLRLQRRGRGGGGRGGGGGVAQMREMLASQESDPRHAHYWRTAAPNSRVTAAAQSYARRAGTALGTPGSSTTGDLTTTWVQAPGASVGHGTARRRQLQEFVTSVDRIDTYATDALNALDRVEGTTSDPETGQRTGPHPGFAGMPERTARAGLASLEQFVTGNERDVVAVTTALDELLPAMAGVQKTGVLQEHEIERIRRMTGQWATSDIGRSSLRNRLGIIRRDARRGLDAEMAEAGFVRAAPHRGRQPSLQPRQGEAADPYDELGGEELR